MSETVSETTQDTPPPESAIDKLVMYMERMSRDIRAIRGDLATALNSMREAEAEVPEKMRRFIMYYHDVHDIRNLFHESGIEPPREVNSEIERCTDRFIHLVHDLFDDNGVFEKVRQEMAERHGNRYDHKRLLPTSKPQEPTP